MSIGHFGHSKSEWESARHTGQDITAAKAAVVLKLQRKNVSFKRSKIKAVALGLAEIAYSMGETNSPEEFAEEMTSDILDALKKVQKRQEKKG